MIFYFDKPPSNFFDKNTPLPNCGINLILLSKDKVEKQNKLCFEKEFIKGTNQFNENSIKHNIIDLIDESKSITKESYDALPKSLNIGKYENFILLQNEKDSNSFNTSEVTDLKDGVIDFLNSQENKLIFDGIAKENSNSLLFFNEQSDIFQQIPPSKFIECQNYNNFRNININNNFNNNDNNIYSNNPNHTRNNQNILEVYASKKPGAKESKYTQMTIKEITYQLPSIIKKQNGCRFLQKLIMSSSDDLVNTYFYPTLYPSKLLEMCKDFFGNYFIQKMIPYLSSTNLNSFTQMVINHLLKLCLDKQGTRVIQSLNEHLVMNPFLLSQFTKALQPLFHRLIKNHNGSFIMMSYARVVPFPHNNVIYDYLNKNIVDVATQPYACCTLQKCIDIGNDEQKLTLLFSIAKNTIYLVSNQYGNYVIQFVLSKKIYDINDKICHSILPNIVNLSEEKYSSNVIEKCFDYCSPQMKDFLIKHLSNEEIIKELIKDMYGNYVLQKALIWADEKIKKIYLNTILKEIGNLLFLPFGYKLIKKLILTFPELRGFVHLIHNNQVYPLNQQMMGLNRRTNTIQMQQNNLFNVIEMNNWIYGNIWNGGFYMSNINKNIGNI